MAETSGSILHRAGDLVDGAREDEHGAKRASFEAIAAIWSSYLTSVTMMDIELHGYHVAQLMVLLKMIRPLYGDATNRDHGLDQCGYSGVAAYLAQED